MIPGKKLLKDLKNDFEEAAKKAQDEAEKNGDNNVFDGPASFFGICNRAGHQIRANGRGFVLDFARALLDPSSGEEEEKEELEITVKQIEKDEE